MLKIRLTRMGAKKKPFYRIVVAESSCPRDGKNVTEIGYYDPTQKPVVLKVDVDAAKEWMKNGAQPSETVKTLLKRAGAL